MNSQGRLTVPAAARLALQVKGATQFELEVTEAALILHRIVIPEEDAWAYGPEHVRDVKRARRDAQEGRVRSLSKGELEQLVAEHATN